MTNVQKNAIVQAIKKEIQRLGSARQVAVKCGISSATISQMQNNNWELIRVEMWQKVASSLQVKFSGWNIATNTTNFKIVNQVLDDAKEDKLFIPVSEKAGSGKSAAAEQYAKQNGHNAVYYIKAREWAKREFLQELSQTLGIAIPKGVISIDRLGQNIIKFFEDRAHLDPLLIIDEADKLKAPALRFTIPLYNRLEDLIGMVILGTENLEKEIKNGVRLQKKGYDEIESRFGRNYIHLIGATQNDVKNICSANGINDVKTQRFVFKECVPVHKRFETDKEPVLLSVVEDMRRVKRVIKRELKKLKNLQNAS